MYEIAWTPAALESYEQILDFILQHWSINQVMKLDQEIKDLESRLKKHPYLCPPSTEYPSLRRCIISKQTSLIHRVIGNTIQIIAVLDNRSKHPFLT